MEGNVELCQGIFLDFVLSLAYGEVTQQLAFSFSAFVSNPNQNDSICFSWFHLEIQNLFVLVLCKISLYLW